MGANDSCADKICYGAIPYKSYEIRNLPDSVLLSRSGFYVFLVLICLGTFYSASYDFIRKLFGVISSLNQDIKEGKGEYGTIP